MTRTESAIHTSLAQVVALCNAVTTLIPQSSEEDQLLMLLVNPHIRGRIAEHYTFGIAAKGLEHELRAHNGGKYEFSRGPAEYGFPEFPGQKANDTHHRSQYELRADGVPFGHISIITPHDREDAHTVVYEGIHPHKLDEFFGIDRRFRGKSMSHTYFYETPTRRIDGSSLPFLEVPTEDRVPERLERIAA